jgi:hypothetical protein
MKFNVSILAFQVMALLFLPLAALAQDSEILTSKLLKITVGNKVLTAALLDNATTRDFIALLPMTVKANDYASREKYWHLTRAISAAKGHQREYERGDLGFWPPNNDMALFYHHDGTLLPEPGLIVVAKVTSGMEALDNYPGSVEFKIELID